MTVAKLIALPLKVPVPVRCQNCLAKLWTSVLIFCS